MIRIAIADDDAAFLAKIEKYIQKYQKENGEDIQLTAFSDAKELIEGYSPVYDIVILDIEMPGMNGMEAAEKIRQADEDVVLMFITNMIQYAIRGYSVGALDFVMKPVEEELEFEDNLPVTTKHDKAYHGYGLRSIKNSVKKYNGVFQVKIKDGCFCLKILFPIKE